MLAAFGELQAEARTTSSPIDRPEATKERFMAKANYVGVGRGKTTKVRRTSHEHFY